MANEIIYTCNSINNKNVREGELKILRKHEDELYFEFGESEINLKKRFYDDVENLNKDFEVLTKLKKEAEVEKENNEVKSEEIDNEEEKNKKNSYTRKNNIF
jgi:hypothetical protein